LSHENSEGKRGLESAVSLTRPRFWRLRSSIVGYLHRTFAPMFVLAGRYHAVTDRPPQPLACWCEASARPAAQDHPFHDQRKTATSRANGSSTCRTRCSVHDTFGISARKKMRRCQKFKCRRSLFGRVTRRRKLSAASTGSICSRRKMQIQEQLPFGHVDFAFDRFPLAAQTSGLE
jgi:hypothetical protein